MCTRCTHFMTHMFKLVEREEEEVSLFISGGILHKTHKPDGPYPPHSAKVIQHFFYRREKTKVCRKLKLVFHQQWFKYKVKQIISISRRIVLLPSALLCMTVSF